MTSSSKANDSSQDFYEGAALDVWRNAISFDETEEQVAFLHEQFNLAEGARILDVPCGNGRLTTPLALCGYELTGVDTCEQYLVEARKAAVAHGVDINYSNCDMRHFTQEKQFDAAICMGNSFGYFDRAGSNEFFAAVNASLKSGAKFVIDTQTVAECFLLNAGEREWVRVGDILMLTETHYDCCENRAEINYTFVRDGKIEQRKAVHWIYTSGEICDMLRVRGFQIVDLLANTDGDPFALGSEKMILIAQKN